MFRPRTSLVLGLLILVGILASSCQLFNQPPKPVIAIADGNPYGSAPLEITFDISGSHDPDGEIVSFSLDFGDGSAPLSGTDLSQPIVHTYQQSGTYFARLTITDNQGKSTVSPGLVISPQ